MKPWIAEKETFNACVVSTISFRYHTDSVLQDRIFRLVASLKGSLNILYKVLVDTQTCALHTPADRKRLERVTRYHEGIRVGEHAVTRISGRVELVHHQRSGSGTASA